MIAPTESERIRWVRYAADCAERVLPLVPPSCRSQAEAAITAARVWADQPTEEHREEAWVAGDTAGDVAIHSAAHAAYAAAHVAYVAHAADHAAYAAAYAAYISADPIQERAWQAERRRYYGLPEAGQ